MPWLAARRVQSSDAHGRRRRAALVFRQKAIRQPLGAGGLYSPPRRGFESESLLGHIGSRRMTISVLRIFAGGSALAYRAHAEGSYSVRSAARF